MKSGIYSITLKNDGRLYIGSAVDIAARWRLHRHHLRKQVHHSRHLQRAWDKYGESAFEFSVVEQCDRLALIEREQHYIDLFVPRFNATPKAGSRLGSTVSEETRQKISAANKGRKMPPGLSEKLADLRRGKNHSDEAKRKMSEAAKARTSKPEVRAQISASAKARMNTEEAKKRQSQISSGRIPSDETRAKMSAAHRGKKLTEQHRRAIASSMTGKTLSEETKQKMRETAERNRENRRRAALIRWGKQPAVASLTEYG